MGRLHRPARAQGRRISPDWAAFGAGRKKFLLTVLRFLKEFEKWG